MSRSRESIYRRENQIFAFRYRDKLGIWREKYTGRTIGQKQSCRPPRRRELDAEPILALPIDASETPVVSQPETRIQ